MPFHWL